MRIHWRRGVLATACATLLATQPAEALQPTGRWNFDEGAGVVARDAGPSHLDGRLLSPSGGAVPSWIAGVQGTALRFDGGNEVGLPDSPALEPARISVAAWVRRNGSPGAYRYVLAKGASTCLKGSYGLYSGRFGGAGFYVSGDGLYAVSPQAAPGDVWDGRWHRLAGTFDGARVRLYVDGIEIGSGTAGPTHIEYGFASRAPYIGAYHGSCDLPFDGDIDAVTIWSAALTPAEAASDATPPAAPPPGSGPIGPVPGAPRPGGSAGIGVPGYRETPAKCTSVAVSRRSVRLGRRTRLVAVVRTGSRRVHRAAVVLRGRGLRTVARTDRRGRARFSVRARSGQRRLALRVRGRVAASCGTPVAYVRVRR